MTAARPRFAVLISGRGSNMQALLAAARDPAFPAEPALVLSNVADAAGLGLTDDVPTAVVPHRGEPDRETHERKVAAAIDASGATLVCLAGYMRRLTPFLVRRHAGRMINIHPSLLPSFPGLDTHARALAAGVRLHGCTVHFVSEGVDEGPIIAQAAVPVAPDDTEAHLAARVLAQEHLLYPRALALVATGRARLAAGRCVLDAPAPPGALANPA